MRISFKVGPMSLNRRDFLTGTIATLATTLIGEKAAYSADKTFALPEEEKKDPLLKDVGIFSTIRTIVEAIALKFAVAGLSNRLTDANVPCGNASCEPEQYVLDVKNKPIQTFAVTCIGKPFFEEAFFRFMPSAFIADSRDDDSVHWGMGMATSAAFALIHNFREDGSFSKTYPVDIAAAGLYFWVTARTRGVAHSFLSHAVCNTISFAAAATYKIQD